MPKRLTDRERADREWSEKEYQKKVVEAAELYGWKWAHFSDSTKQVRGRGFVGDTGAAGFPDLALVHPRYGFACLEIKKELGDLRPKQGPWLDALLDGGVPAAVSRPSTFEQTCEWLAHGFPKDVDSLRTYR